MLTVHTSGESVPPIFLMREDLTEQGVKDTGLR